MADSMCGPSNALQSFQKHSTVDRTLQQDRLISRHPAAQGFRSSPAPNSQHIDPEFEAFQAGNLPLDHGYQAQGPPGFSHAPPNFHQPGAANWADDFQSLNISSPQTGFPKQAFHGQTQQKQGTREWQQDFARQQSKMAGPSMSQAQNQMGRGYGYVPMQGGQIGMGYNPQFAGSGFVGPQAESSIAQQRSEAFDEEAFARAFDEAAKAEMDISQESSSAQEQTVKLSQDILLEASAERLMSEESQEELLARQERIGADEIHDPMKSQSQHDQDDPDALARVASELLNKVQHDQSSKFQNSTFLQLMRQFRDREAVVDGVSIVKKGTRADMGEQEEERNVDGRGAEEETMKKISILSHTLKRLALDRDRPFVRTSSNVRYMLQTLLQLDQLLRAQSGTLSQEMVERSMLRRTLSALIESPSLNGIPSTRILAIYLLGVISEKNLTSHIAGDELAFVALEQELQRIAAANREIAPGSLPSITGDYDTMNINRKGNSELASSSSSSSTTPEMQFLTTSLSKTLRPRQDVLASLLGYIFTPTPNPHGDTAVSLVHEQRAEDILGPAFTSVARYCQKRGFWCGELSAGKFWRLVSVYERVGGKEEDGVVFWDEVRRVEVGIGERLRGEIERGGMGGEESRARVEEAKS